MAPVKREQGPTKPGPSRTTRSRDNIPIRAPSLAPTITAPHSPVSDAQSAAAGHDVLPTLDSMAVQPQSTDPDAAESSSSDTMNHDRDHDVDMTNELCARSQDAMEILGGEGRELIQVMQRLANLNIDARTLPSLPRIAVIGDQSAGKSSLVENICGIKLPRSQGTCTRVPIHITTTADIWTSSAWTARISLNCSYSYLPTAPARAGKYAKWNELKEPDVIPFATIFDMAQLDATLRQAQLALLNPHKNPADFINKDITEDKSFKVGFSPNVVSLEIFAANLAELSFFDLPGAINTTPDENESYLVGTVQKMLMGYMADKKTIIVLACPANQDMENSTANKWLRKCKAEGRSLGVLTKPDLMEKINFRVNTVKNMLQNKVYGLGYGWFVAKQPSQDDIQEGVAHEEAREMGDEFFGTTPWGDHLGAHSDRFGIVNLRKSLSHILRQHILDDLPEIVGRVDTRLQAVKKELATYPEPSADPGIVVNTEIYNLNTNIQRELGAESADSEFRRAHRTILRDSRDLFKDARPKVDLNTPGYQQPIVSLDSSDDEEEESPTKRAMTVSGSAATPSRQRTPAIRTPASERQRKLPVAQMMEPPRATLFKLDQVKHEYDSAPGADITGQTSTTVTQKLRLQPLSGWHTIADIMLAGVETAFREMLNSALQASLGSRQATLLYRSAAHTQLALFTEIMTQQRQFFHHRITIECHRAMTLSSAIVSKETLETTHLIASRREHRVKEHLQILERRQNKMMTSPDAIKKHANDPKWMAENIGDDPFQREVEALAKPLAYYDIASSQLLDTFAKQLDYELMHMYGEQLLPRLLKDLRVTDNAHCAALLAEDEARERQRASLEVEKGKLEAALVELRGLPDVHG